MTLPKDFMYLWCLVKDKTRTILLLHLAVFLAGWTGVFGRLITLSGLPLVWYRIMISIVTMAAVMAISGRFAEQTGEDSATMLFYELVGGLAILSLCMPFYAGAHPGAITPGKGDLASLLVLGSVLTITPFLLQINSLRKLSAFTVNVTPRFK